MKKIVETYVCDMTKKECAPKDIRTIGKVPFQRRHTFLDAAGSSDWEWRDETLDIDLSHDGAIELLKSFLTYEGVGGSYVRQAVLHRHFS